MFKFSSFLRLRSSSSSSSSSLIITLKRRNKLYSSSSFFSSSSSSSSSNNHQLVPLQNGLLPSTNNPWKQQTDPNGSGLTYWWNPETNETTSLGSPKPQHWVEVQDPNGSNLTYWWNPESNDTTSLGSPRPHYLQQYQQYQQVGEPASFGRHLFHMMGLGFGVSFGIILIRVLFGF